MCFSTCVTLCAVAGVIPHDNTQKTCGLFMQRFQQLNELQVAGICALFAGLCSSLSYLLKVEEGHPFKWREFALHITISSVFGLMTFEVLDYYGFPPQVAGALCGAAGWMGTRLIRILEIVVRKKLGVTKEELND